ncbi:MAG TPA: Uma2 family endonuclease [Kofleriaceae bacterium]|nr:Uma2 family endonuclease [Kofleriaceae bacterium]
MSDSIRKATAADLLAKFGEDARIEIIHGEFVPKAMPRVPHSRSYNYFVRAISQRFDRKPGGKWPGGWFICPELHVHYGETEVFCHDACGYRRDLHPELPNEWPCKIRPDWVCELLSPNHQKHDLVDKWKVLQAAGVPHYWIVDPEEKLLRVHRLDAAGYTCILTASLGDVVRAEPFDAVELRVSALFGDEDDDE